MGAIVAGVSLGRSDAQQQVMRPLCNMSSRWHFAKGHASRWALIWILNDPVLQRVIVLDSGGCTVKAGYSTTPDDVR